MAKVWSFNTTIRNPERMENMLRALTDLEGLEFDEHGQEVFFGLQIKKRLYKPTKKTLRDSDLISAVYDDSSGDDIDDVIVERILAKYRRSSVNGSGRGRTAAGILNRFGLCVAKKSKGSVVITELAKKWLQHEIDDEELFTKFFIKWQYPNKIESGYEGFNIKPFIATLALIKSVNKKWEVLGNKPVGLSNQEYQLFVTSLTKPSQIEEYAEKIINYRSEKESKTGKDKTDYIKEFEIRRAKEIFGNAKIKKSLSNLRDYMDSSKRYFRTSGLIAFRGADNYVDISKEKEVEVNSILDSISASSLKFESYETYFNYLSNMESVHFPWQNDDDLIKINEQLSNVIKLEAEELNIDNYLPAIDGLSINKKKDTLEKSLNEIRILKLRGVKHDISVLDECIKKLSSITDKNYENTTARPSLDLEWYVSRALMVLNDAIKIDPSFNIGDDGIPTGFRPNVSDIECYYESFNMTVEPTLLCRRDQWIAEGQPVMRHLRDFENKTEHNVVYCLFIAPSIHRDTLNTFWGSNKYGYEGKIQKIIPFTIIQFIEILKIAKNKISENNLSHQSINNLFESISGSVSDFEISQEWMDSFPNLINEW